MTSSSIFSKILLPLLLCVQAADQDVIDRLIKQLASPRFQVRELATQRLLKRCPDAIPALNKALRSADIEVAKRAAVILEKFERRPLELLERFNKEGKVDLATDLLARWPKGKNEEVVWREACKLVAKLTEAGINKGFKPRFGAWPKPQVKRLPLVVSSERVTRTAANPYGYTFVRAAEVDCVDGFNPSAKIIFVSGGVRFRRDCGGSAVFAAGSVYIREADAAFIVSDGDVEFQGASCCIIIARGKVTWPRFGGPQHCLIVSGDSITSSRKNVVNCKIIEKESNPLGFIQFFDPAKEGITAEKTKGGVRVTKITAGKPFQKAGLQKGDIITRINDTAVDSPEVFRRILRRQVAFESKMTFHVIRNGIKLQIKMRPFYAL